MQAMLEARRLTRYYAAIPAIRDVSLTLRPGIILGLLGANGSGKSTTVSILTGLREPSTANSSAQPPKTMSTVMVKVVGMYSVMAYAVQQRTYEIGVRLALGAGLNQIRNMVLLDGLKLTSCGVAFGGVTAAALARTLSAFLFGVRAQDLMTFTVSSAVLAVAAITAVWIPARRASSLDPADILRGQ